VLFHRCLVTQYSLFQVIIYCASSVYLWLHIQYVVNMDVIVWIYTYGYYIVEIWNIISDGLTPWS